MEPIYGAAALVLVAMVSGLVTWLVPRRAKSGKINTSEAAVLWIEGTKMREELRKEVDELRARLTEAIAAITDLNKEIKAARSETERAREETRFSRAETRRLMAQIEDLHGDVRTYNALTIGNLADNIETRRILLLPKGERTPTEFEHLSTVGERQPQGDHPPVDSDDLPDGEYYDEGRTPDE